MGFPGGSDDKESACAKGINSNVSRSLMSDSLQSHWL